MTDRQAFIRKIDFRLTLSRLTFLKYSYFEFWPKVVSCLRQVQKVFLRIRTTDD